MKSALESLQGSSLKTKFSTSSYDRDKYLPKEFLDDFLDFAAIDTGKPVPRVFTQTNMAFEKLAQVTNTRRECYDAMPAPISNITDVCEPLCASCC